GTRANIYGINLSSTFQSLENSRGGPGGEDARLGKHNADCAAANRHQAARAWYEFKSLWSSA
ncbi:MAG: hypothetical protein ABJB10_13745, partial [Mesorhizobium sp.]